MTNDQLSHLKPCPFCGGEAEWCHHEGDPLKLEDEMAGAHWIECVDCGTSTNLRYSLMDDCRPLLAEQWNRRTASEATAAQQEPLTELERMKIIGQEFPLALVQTVVIQKIDAVCLAIEAAHGIAAPANGEVKS